MFIFFMLAHFLFRGNVGVVMFNHNDVPFVIKKGDRVAQLVCEKISYPELEEVQSLENTERGEGGFGSTGVAAAATADKMEEGVTAS